MVTKYFRAIRPIRRGAYVRITGKHVPSNIQYVREIQFTYEYSDGIAMNDAPLGSDLEVQLHEYSEFERRIRFAQHIKAIKTIERRRKRERKHEQQRLKDL